jgi:molecular chaperone DnaJ
MDYNKNYYDILGVNKNSSNDEIKKAYRKLSKIHHPDINETGSDDKFKEISSAYSVLSDTNQKQEYDTRSPHGNSYTPFSGFGNGFGGFSFGSGIQFDDLFNSFFGGFNPFQNEEFRENLDINITTTVNLKQIYLNEILKIKYDKFVHCDKCNGTGFDIESKSDICDVCDGTGKHNGKICEYCLGSGKIYSGKCEKCKGEKVTLFENEINVQNLSQLRTHNKGVYNGYGHQSKYYRDKIGKLILTIKVDRNDDYTLENMYNLSKTIDIHYQDAIDGNEIYYNHIDDTNIKIKLPEKTNNGDIIKLKDCGLLKNNDGLRGDLYLKINIIINYEKL